MATKGNNSNAMVVLGLLYYDQEKFDLAEEYYLMAIEDNNSLAMYNLGLFYKNQNEIKLARKYLEMAFNSGDINAKVLLDELNNK